MSQTIRDYWVDHYVELKKTSPKMALLLADLVTIERFGNQARDWIDEEREATQAAIDLLDQSPLGGTP